MLEICPTPNPTLNLPDSVNNRAISTSLYADLNCFVQLWFELELLAS